MSALNCGACGAGIGPTDLACSRCGSQVSRSAGSSATIQAGNLVSGVVKDLEAGQGAPAVFIHAAFLLGCIVPLFVFIPVLCAMLLKEGAGRRHAQACLWFALDRFLCIVAVQATAAVVAIIGGVMGGVGGSFLHGAKLGVQTFASVMVALWITWLFAGIFSTILYISGLICFGRAAVAARDGNWFVYPVYIVDARKTQPW